MRIAFPAQVPRWQVAGKTGSLTDYEGGADYSWFVGYAPANNPRVAIYVTVDQAAPGTAPLQFGSLLIFNLMIGLLTPPVDDRLFAEPHPTHGKARVIVAAPSTKHREDLLTPAKHAHDVRHVAHGITPESIKSHISDILNSVYEKDHVRADDRLLYPLRRVGAKGEGRFERISWDEATAEMQRLFGEIEVPKQANQCGKNWARLFTINFVKYLGYMLGRILHGRLLAK